MTSAIVTSTYRYKRPPRKRRKLAEITGPRIVTPADPKKSRRRVLTREAAAEVLLDMNQNAHPLAGDAQSSTEAPPLANADGPRRPAIVTVRDRKTREQQQMAKLMQGDGTTALSSRSAIIAKPHPSDMTPAEHQRRGDAADALFREIVRRVAAR
jgi:hypothetical protein